MTFISVLSFQKKDEKIRSQWNLLQQNPMVSDYIQLVHHDEHVTDSNLQVCTLFTGEKSHSLYINIGPRQQR